jgi:hypothetical protein
MQLRLCSAWSNARISEKWFGGQFPYECPDGGHNAGCDTQKLKTALGGYKVIWPEDWPDRDRLWPADPQIFDLLEFSYEHVALPKAYGFHSFFSHDHLSYDTDPR